MDFWGETNWFAVQSKPRLEDLAAARLARLGVQVFLPRIRQEQLMGGITRVVIKPMFTGYFFVRFCPLLLLDAVRYAQGVLRVVGNRHSPIPLDAEVILAIQDRVRADGFIRLEPKSFQLGDRVSIERGPFESWIGRIEREWNDGKRVLILLEAIRQARVVVEKQWLTVATEVV